MCLRVEPWTAGWKAQTNPLSYGGTQLCMYLRRQIMKTNIDWHLATKPVTFYLYNERRKRNVKTVEIQFYPMKTNYAECFR